MFEWFHLNQYSQRPSEYLDPHFELKDSQRNYIDLAYMRKEKSHVQRIKDILAGKVTVDNKRIAPSDPYPRPRQLDINSLKQKGSKFFQRLTKEAGW